MKQPSLSLCICFRNAEQHLERCLESLLSELNNKSVSGSEVLSSLEIILVDHSSTDRSFQLAEAFEEKFQKLKQIKTKYNLFQFDPPGIASVRNFAWRNTNSDWIAFVDSDCTFRPGWLSSAVNSIQRFTPKASVAAIGGANYVYESHRTIYQAFKVLLPTYMGGHGSPLNQVYRDVREVEHLPTLNVIYRRAALENVGGFQEHFVKVGEDLDLSARLRAYGYRMIYEPSLGVEHLLRSRSWDWAQNMYLYGRGRVFFLWNHPERFELKFLLPPLMIVFYAVSILIPWLFLLIFGMHIFVLLFSVLIQMKTPKFSWKVWFFAAYLGWVTHIFYGLGALRQLITPWRLIW